MVQYDFNKGYGEETSCVCEKKQMSPIMTKYFDTSRKMLPQEMTICIMEALIFMSWKLWLMSFFSKIGQTTMSKAYVPTERSYM